MRFSLGTRQICQLVFHLQWHVHLPSDSACVGSITSVYLICGSFQKHYFKSALNCTLGKCAVRPAVKQAGIVKTKQKNAMALCRHLRISY